MQDFLFNHYDWIKAFHVIAIIAWMAGLLYLPRLFVYHAEAKKGSDVSETLKVMERKLLRVIMSPAMMAAWVLGGLMLYANPTVMTTGGWMHVKLTAVLGITVVHMIFAKWRKTFEADNNTRSHKFYRLMNEVPTALMIVIVIMAIAEPF